MTDSWARKFTLNPIAEYLVEPLVHLGRNGITCGRHRVVLKVRLLREEPQCAVLRILRRFERRRRSFVISSFRRALPKSSFQVVIAAYGSKSLLSMVMMRESKAGQIMEIISSISLSVFRSFSQLEVAITKTQFPTFPTYRI